MKKVYLISVNEYENTYYKIGVSKDVSKRVKNISTGNHLDVQILKEIKSAYPTKLEKRLHSHFKNKNVKGEWFVLDSADLEAFESICDKYENVFKILKDNPFFK